MVNPASPEDTGFNEVVHRAAAQRSTMRRRRQITRVVVVTLAVVAVAVFVLWELFAPYTVQLPSGEVAECEGAWAVTQGNQTLEVMTEQFEACYEAGHERLSWAGLASALVYGPLLVRGFQRPMRRRDKHGTSEPARSPAGSRNSSAALG